MANKKDPLNTELSASVNVTETSIEAKLKLRAASAFDRLCGNVFEFVGLKIERSNTRERAIIETEEAVIVAARNSVVSRIKTEPAFADRVIENQLKGIFRKQKNKDAIAKIAYEEIKKHPPAQETSEEPEQLDEDWLNRFEIIAESASTEKMQQLFGKILSGEIRKPGAFSLTTLRVASELNQQTAQLFQDIAGIRVGYAVPEFDDSTDISKFLDLEVAGLIKYDGGELYATETSTNNKTIEVAGDEIYAVIEITKPQDDFTYQIIRLTEVGIELANLIPNNELQAMKAIIESCKDRIIKVELFRITGHRDDDEILFEDHPFETIRFRNR